VIDNFPTMFENPQSSCYLFQASRSLSSVHVAAASRRLWASRRCWRKAGWNGRYVIPTRTH